MKTSEIVDMIQRYGVEIVCDDNMRSSYYNPFKNRIGLHSNQMNSEKNCAYALLHEFRHAQQHKLHMSGLILVNSVLYTFRHFLYVLIVFLSFKMALYVMIAVTGFKFFTELDANIYTLRRVKNYKLFKKSQISYAIEPLLCITVWAIISTLEDHLAALV